MLKIGQDNAKLLIDELHRTEKTRYRSSRSFERDIKRIADKLRIDNSLLLFAESEQQGNSQYGSMGVKEQTEGRGGSSVLQGSVRDAAEGGATAVDEELFSLKQTKSDTFKKWFGDWEKDQRHTIHS